MRYVVAYRPDPDDWRKTTPVAAYVADWTEPGTMGSPSVFQQRHLLDLGSYVTDTLPEGYPIVHLVWKDGDYHIERLA